VGIGLVITTLGVDITKEAGRLVFGLMAQIAEFERGLIRERVNAGLKAAKARGQALGRKPRLTQHQRKEAARMAAEGKSYAEIAATLGVARSIAFRAVKEMIATQAAQAEAA
jgi:DNA invertase Pin-like site-specific DNA recombinase